jgi:hypothetical protein
MDSPDHGDPTVFLDFLGQEALMVLAESMGHVDLQAVSVPGPLDLVDLLVHVDLQAVSVPGSLARQVLG